MSSSRTLAYTEAHGCIIYVSAKRPPSDADWDEYLRFLAPLMRPGINRCLVVERGAGPSASQRKRLQTLTKGHTSRVAVIATSALARGVVTALSWATPGYQAFSPKDLGGALDYLGVEGEANRGEIRLALARIQGALDQNR